MPRDTPVITIDFEEHESGFVIEELTFNPYIFIESPFEQEPSCNIWIEFALRNARGTSGGRMPPPIVITIEHINRAQQKISTAIPQYISGLPDGGDLNFV